MATLVVIVALGAYYLRFRVRKVNYHLAAQDLKYLEAEEKAQKNATRAEELVGRYVQVQGLIQCSRATHVCAYQL